MVTKKGLGAKLTFKDNNFKVKIIVNRVTIEGLPETPDTIKVVGIFKILDNRIKGEVIDKEGYSSHLLSDNFEGTFRVSEDKLCFGSVTGKSWGFLSSSHFKKDPSCN